MDLFTLMEFHRGIPFEWVSRSFHGYPVKFADGPRAFDGKAKVWSTEQRTCVATHAQTDRTLWTVKWLPKTGRSEGFVTAGASKSIAFYREATGG